jgi:acetyl esterase/lipase
MKMRMMMKAIIAAVLLPSAVFASDAKVLPLWPGVAPGSENWTQKEQQKTSERDGTLSVSNVVDPTLTVYLPEASKANGTAVIVCPGGAFVNLGMAKEGSEIARWLNSMGIAAFVLKYRLARTGDEEANDPVKLRERAQAVIPLALADAQQAMRLVRSHAAEWGIARNRIGIMGFSAGGYVAISLALQHDAETRPDFLAPVYPGVPPTITVPADAPPLFLVHADDDERAPTLATSVRLYSAWKAANVPAELHIYSHGGHGFALRRIGMPVNNWTEQFRAWLESQGLLKPIAHS